MYLITNIFPIFMYVRSCGDGQLRLTDWMARGGGKVPCDMLWLYILLNYYGLYYLVGMSPEHLLMMTLYGFELGLRDAWIVSLFTIIILLLLLLSCRVLTLGQSLYI